MKIGMYTEDEIFNYMTNCEGSMLGRSMYDAVFGKLHALITENEQLKADYGNKAQVERDLLEEENKQLKEDISFCLKSIKQEMEMSTDSRTKQEMLSCYQILSKWSDK